MTDLNSTNPERIAELERRIAELQKALALADEMACSNTNIMQAAR